VTESYIRLLKEKSFALYVVCQQRKGNLYIYLAKAIVAADEEKKSAQCAPRMENDMKFLLAIKGSSADRETHRRRGALARIKNNLSRSYFTTLPELPKFLLSVKNNFPAAAHAQ
jgi:hypothetical protein